MLHRDKWPVIEYDDNPVAKLNPAHYAGDGFDTDKLVITFFPEVIEKLLLADKIKRSSVIPGENPVIIYRFTDKPDVLLTLGQVGCPACGGNLDLFNAMGITKVMFCGGGGVLDNSLEVGQILVVEGAIRDEGFSYQYVPASRIIYTDPDVNKVITEYLEKQNVSYLSGLVWTTDAIFRETADRIELRKSEGARIVEMEQAGCIAVAQFRKFSYGALIYSGDDLSGDEWDGREWRSREGVRYDLVRLCSELVSLI
ncbi:MAG: nucleoside phosphorylase [Oscillospiraceae bacterium]|nr:nucleoside phosphorylase [Oscillospiraceae bacterium]